MTDFDDEVLKGSIKKLVDDADLATCTVKAIVESLEQQMGQAAIERRREHVKDLVDTVLMDRLLAEEDAKMARELQAQENRRTRSGGRTPRAHKSQPRGAAIEKKKKRGSPSSSSSTGFHKPYILSAALSDLLGGEKSLSRPAVVKKIWEYVKVHELQDPANKRIIRCDTKLEAVFKRKRLDCFQMNKFLVSHLHALDDVSVNNSVDDDDDDDDPDSFTPPPTLKRASIRENCQVPEFLRPIIGDNIPSPSTHRIIQDAFLNYLRDHHLFDPQNPTLISLDDKLVGCFGLSSEEGLKKQSLFDFVDKVRAILEDNQ